MFSPLTSSKDRIVYRGRLRNNIILNPSIFRNVLIQVMIGGFKAKQGGGKAFSAPLLLQLAKLETCLGNFLSLFARLSALGLLLFSAKIKVVQEYSTWLLHLIGDTTHRKQRDQFLFGH